MKDLIEKLKNSEQHYSGNFDTPARANAVLLSLCQEAAEALEDHIRDATKMIEQPAQQESVIGETNVELGFYSNDASNGQQRKLVGKMEMGQLVGNRPHKSASNPDTEREIAVIAGVDEYGPMLNWYTHWVNFPVGTALYTSQTAPVQQILSAFPLLDDEGLDEEKHHCEWTLQQDRKRLHAMLAAAPQPAQQEPVAFGALAKRRVFDYIRGAYDLGYNDARNAKAIPGDSAPGYKGRDVEADHGSALLHALEAITSPPAQRKPLTPERIFELASEHQDWDRNLIRVRSFARAIEAAHGIKENT